MNIVTGDKELDRKLKELAETGAKKAIRAGVGKGIRVIAKAQKQRVPPQYKHLKKLIGSRFGKTKSSKGQAEAKAGFGVGKKRTTKDKATGDRIASKLTQSRKLKQGEKRRGVGLSLYNIHWIVLGTNVRRHKKSGHPTGKMPPILEKIIPEATASAISSAKQEIADGINKTLEREANK